MRGPKHYRSLEEFTREEIRKTKLGWSLDDLYEEANIHKRPNEEEAAGDPRELNFDF